MQRRCLGSRPLTILKKGIDRLPPTLSEAGVRGFMQRRCLISRPLTILKKGMDRSIATHTQFLKQVSASGQPESTFTISLKHSFGSGIRMPSFLMNWRTTWRCEPLGSLGPEIRLHRFISVFKHSVAAMTSFGGNSWLGERLCCGLRIPLSSPPFVISNNVHAMELQRHQVRLGWPN